MITKRKSITTLFFQFIVLAVLCLAAWTSVLADAEKAKEHFNAALTAEQNGDEAGAITSYEAAITEDAGFIDAYINLGAIHFRQKNYDQALQSFKAATEKDQQNADAFANLGRVEYALKKYAEAEMAFKTASTLKPDSPNICKELGKVYYKKQNYPEVINAFTKCHELGGGDYLTYFMMGKAYQKQNNLSEAITALQKSIGLRDNYYNAHSALGSIYLSQEKYRSAAGAFQAAMKADPGKYRAAYNYAVAAEQSNPEDFDANIANWENFIRVARKNPKASKDVAVAQDHVKELKEAKEKASLQ